LPVSDSARAYFKQLFPTSINNIILSITIK
jgi:hypothetical protein